MKASKFIRPVFMLVLFLGLCIGQVHADGKKKIKVADAKTLKMSPKTHSALTKAFKAVFAKKMGFERLVIETDGQPFLVMYGQRGTVAIPLKIDGEYAVIDAGGGTAAVICSTTTSCSCCKATSCACSKKNGGQEDCGSSDCDKDESVTSVGQIAEMASSYGL
jgi:hypothetical protein